MNSNIKYSNNYSLTKFPFKIIVVLRYLEENIIDADYAHDLTLLANTSIQAESLLQRLEQVERGIGLYMNLDKKELIYIYNLFLCHCT